MILLPVVLKAVVLVGLSMAGAAPPTSATDPAPRPTLSFDDALASAKARSPELDAIAERVKEAEANVGKAWALLKPQWNVSYNLTHLEPAPPAIEFPEPINLADPNIQMFCKTEAEGGDLLGCVGALGNEVQRIGSLPPRRLDFANQDTHSISTRATWTILDGRAIPLLLNARDNVALEGDRADTKSRELLLVVAKAYYSASATKAAIAVTERSLERARAQVAIAESRAEVGDRALPLLEAAKSAVRLAETDVARSKNAHQQSLLALAGLIERPDRPDVEAPPVLTRPSGDRDALLSDCLRRRPDLAAAEKVLALADRAQDEFWWSFVPNLSLFAGWRYSNVKGLTGQNDQWSFGINAIIPLYDGGARYADLEAAQSRLRTAHLALDTLRSRLEGDLDRAMLRLESADLSKERSLETQRLAERNLEVVKAQREVGAVRPLELQEAADAVLDAELGTVRADVEIAIATLDLIHAVGRFAP